MRWVSFMWRADQWHDPSTAEAVFCGAVLLALLVALIVAVVS